MKFSVGHIFAALFAALLLVSCHNGGRVLSAGKLSRIYADMFLSDQWLADYPEFRKEADTTLYYGAVFKKYSCTKDDFLASVDYYMKNNPSKLVEIVGNAAGILEKKLEELRITREEYDRAMKIISSFPAHERIDFKSDTLLWAPADTSAADTLEVETEKRDSTDGIEQLG